MEEDPAMALGETHEAGNVGELVVSFELDGLAELRDKVREMARHLEAALDIADELNGEHVIDVRCVSRPSERTTSRNAGNASRGGAS